MTLATTTTTMPRARAIAPRRAPSTTRKSATTTTRSTAIDAGDRFATATRTLAAVTLAATLAMQQPTDIAHAKSGADANVIERSSGLSPISDKAKSYGEEIDAREAGDYESSKRGSYNVREKYAKKAPKATKRFERPVREERRRGRRRNPRAGGSRCRAFRCRACRCRACRACRASAATRRRRTRRRRRRRRRERARGERDETSRTRTRSALDATERV